MCCNVRARSFGKIHTEVLIKSLPNGIGKGIINWFLQRYPWDEAGVRVSHAMEVRKGDRMLYAAPILRPCQIQNLCNFASAVNSPLVSGHVRILSSGGDLRFVYSVVLKYVQGKSNARDGLARLELSVLSWEVNGADGQVKTGTGVRYTQAQWVQAVRCAKDVVDAMRQLPASALHLSDALQDWPDRPNVPPPIAPQPI